MPGAQIADPPWHSRGRLACWSAVVLALIASTSGLYEFVPRYRPSDRQLLDNTDLRRGLAAWSTRGQVRADRGRSGTLLLEVPGPAPEVSAISQAVDLRTPAAVIVHAEIAAEVVDPGDGSSGLALMILGNLAGSTPASLYWEKGAAQPYLARSSHGWLEVNRILSLPAGEGQLTFEAGIWGGAGSALRIADLTVLEASERTPFRVARLALMLAWGLTAIWGSAVVWRSLGSASTRLAFATVVGAAACGLMMPESWRQQLSQLLGGTPETIGHALVFLLLALTCRVGRPLDPSWLSFLILALVAGASEVVQSFVPGRGPDLHDWLSDLAGIVAGLALAGPALRLYSRIIGRRKRVR